MIALVVGLVLVIAGLPIVLQALRTTPCDNVHFRSQTGVVNPPSQPPPIGEPGIVRSLRQFLRGGSAAVYCDDFPDPFVLRVGDSYYAYSTNTSGFNIPVLTTHGLFGTGGRREALPKLPAWSDPGWVWGPSVLQRGNTFVLYYATRSHALGRQCLSLAVATRPVGPFVDHSPGPLVCGPGDAYDPSPFVDASGQAYLLWSNAASILSQPLASDGRSLVGGPTTLMRAGQPWEGGVVEAPSMVAAGGHDYLVYSGNQWLTANYAIGYAGCASPLGPCVKAPGPWLASGYGVEGPGGQEFFTDPSGRLWMSLHAWVQDKVGYPFGARNLFVLPIVFRNGVPEPA